MGNDLVSYIYVTRSTQRNSYMMFYICRQKDFVLMSDPRALYSDDHFSLVQ